MPLIKDLQLGMGPKEDEAALVKLDALKQDQAGLQQVLGIRTFGQIQDALSDRLKVIAPRANLGASKLNPDDKHDPNNLHSNLPKCLNPFAVPQGSALDLTTERQLVSDVLMMFASHGVESGTFTRDERYLAVTFKLRHDLAVTQAKLSHLSPGLVKSVLGKFLSHANQLQRGLFLFRGLALSEGRLSTVM